MRAEYLFWTPYEIMAKLVKPGFNFAQANIFEIHTMNNSLEISRSIVDLHQSHRRGGNAVYLARRDVGD